MFPLLPDHLRTVCPSSGYFLWVCFVICVPTWHLRLAECIHMCDQKAATASRHYTSSIHGPVITTARTPVLVISAGCLSVFCIFLRNSSSLSFFLEFYSDKKYCSIPDMVPSDCSQWHQVISMMNFNRGQYQPNLSGNSSQTLQNTVITDFSNIRLMSNCSCLQAKVCLYSMCN